MITRYTTKNEYGGNNTWSIKLNSLPLHKIYLYETKEDAIAIELRKLRFFKEKILTSFVQENVSLREAIENSFHKIYDYLLTQKDYSWSVKKKNEQLEKVLKLFDGKYKSAQEEHNEKREKKKREKKIAEAYMDIATGCSKLLNGYKSLSPKGEIEAIIFCVVAINNYAMEEKKITQFILNRIGGLLIERAIKINPSLVGIQFVNLIFKRINFYQQRFNEIHENTNHLKSQSEIYYCFYIDPLCSEIEMEQNIFELLPFYDYLVNLLRCLNKNVIEKLDNIVSL